MWKIFKRNSTNLRLYQSCVNTKERTALAFELVICLQQLTEQRAKDDGTTKRW